MENDKTEGYWRSSIDEVSPLAWPTADTAWQGRLVFLQKLDRIQSDSEFVAAAGFSRCRLCGKANGSIEYVRGAWSWPEGYRHYIAEHGIRPSLEFEEFIKAESTRLP